MEDFVDNNEPTLDVLGMLKRRKLSIIIPTAAIALLSLAVALGLPAIYESRATILIQNQQIPQEYVSSTVEIFAGQQVQLIQQMVLTQDNVSQLSNKFGLFKGSGNMAPADLVGLFEQNMAVELISAEYNNTTTGKATSAVIAFDIAFQDRSPVTAQRVVNDLATKFMEENTRLRTERAEGAEEFISSESALLDAELKRLEEDIAKFKEEHKGNLPSQYDFNVSTLERTERQMLDLEFRMQEFNKRKIQLESQLAQVSPSKPVVLSTGEVVLSDMDRLSALQSEYSRAAALYKENHPSVIQLQYEIATLKEQLGVETNTVELQKQLQAQKALLTELQGKYTDDHQEIQDTKRLIAQLESEIRTATTSGAASVPEEVADNPAYILLKSQLDLANSEIETSRKKFAELEEKIIQLEQLIAEAPQVEREYTAIQRDYNNAVKKYQELKGKQRETAIAKNLEQDRKGERFILIDPASAPTDPVSPNRPMILAIGFALALGSGVGLAFIRETLDNSIRGTGQLHAVMGVAPLVAIPYIENEEDVEAARKTRNIALGIAIASVVLLIVFVHFFYRPLDVLFYVVLNKLGFS